MLSFVIDSVEIVGVLFLLLLMMEDFVIYYEASLLNFSIVHDGVFYILLIFATLKNVILVHHPLDNITVNFFVNK